MLMIFYLYIKIKTEESKEAKTTTEDNTVRDKGKGTEIDDHFKPADKFKRVI